MGSLIDVLSSFTLGHDNLVRLADNNRSIYDKSGLGHNEEDKSQSSDTSSDITFISSSSTSSSQKSFTVKVKFDKAKERPPYRKKVPFRPKTNSKGSKRVWVPKSNIIPIADVLDSTRKTPVMVFG